MNLDSNIGNIITLVTGIIGVTAAFFTLKGHVKTNKASIDAINKQQEKENLLLHMRIEKTNAAADRYIEKADAEFKEIRSTMNDIKIGQSKIEGMVKLILEK